jgi:hypothetical protein
MYNKTSVGWTAKVRFPVYYPIHSGVLSSRMKQMGHETNSSPSSTPKIKNVELLTSISNTSHGVVLS